MKGNEGIENGRRECWVIVEEELLWIDMIWYVVNMGEDGEEWIGLFRVF